MIIDDTQTTYDQIRSGHAGFYEQRRGLIAVWGKEAVQFLDGLVSNDVKRLGDGAQVLAAFPNAQGRLLAVVRVLRQGDRFLFETEEPTREKVYQNLFRFTFAGEFFVEDLSDEHSWFEFFGPKEDIYHPGVGERYSGALAYELPYGAGYFVPNDLASAFREFVTVENRCEEISDDLYETLRIEAGVPKYAVDISETTIVPELGIEGLISYKKGCYIGQEIIARIHFRGHVAKQLTGLMSGMGVVAAELPYEMELTAGDGKNAGRITSVTFSPKLQRTVALAFVRYDYLPEGTELTAGDQIFTVTALPFVN